MQAQLNTPPTRAFMAALRAGLMPSGGASRVEEQAPPFTPLNNRELETLARVWRRRERQGDEGADSVAQALESVAAARSAATTRHPLRAVVERLSDLMQLS